MKLRYIFGISLLIPVSVRAAGQVIVNTGVATTIPRIMNGFLLLMIQWSSMVATAIFLVGAILMVGSGGNDEYLSAGKKLMKASVTGYAIILGSWLILSTAVYFIAGG